MSAAFDAGAIERHGWRQGAVLAANLAAEARKLAPTGVLFAESDWLVVTSHDCDVVNGKLEKEPVIEVLRAAVVQQKKPDNQQVWGRNPREMQLAADDGAGGSVVLSVKVHERWTMPREMLMLEGPRTVLDSKTRRLIAEWLAKRYIRAAFPTAFDARWRRSMKEWTQLLEQQSQWVQGVYLMLNTHDELASETAYRIDLLIAAPTSVTKDAAWIKKKSELEGLVETFWKRFAPGIVLDGVAVISTSKLTLADIEPYQRFDADWVSFADDSAMTPMIADMPG
jgi:hypothetical protein